MTLLRTILTLCLFTLLTGCARHTAIPQERVCIKPCEAVRAPITEVTPQREAMAPRPSPPSVTTAKPLIIIDPGHGGKDLGAVSPTKPVYQEKNLNLAGARLVEQFLKQQGYRVVMTRTDDTFLTLDERVDITKNKKANLFISIHFNSAPNKTAEGIEVFYYQPDKDKDKSKERTKQSEALAKTVLDKVLQATQANSRGVKHGNFAVIRNNTVPAILIEGGFLTNEKEMEKIKDPAYMKKLAWGIAQGIDSYIKANVKE